MLANLLLATAFQVLPFYEQKPDADYYAVRPFWSTEAEVTDVLWPVFTSHRDWWRFCYFMNWQRAAETDGGYQFSLLPIWFNGRDEKGESYAGLFPIAGYHPHLLMMRDVKFGLWPLWHQYKKPRGRDWLTTNSVLFPFVSWRSDGAWSFWPFYGLNKQRESDHQYALWPLVTWASYREDRDTAGAGYSWMVFPLFSQVERARETQTSFLPPFFSFATTAQSRRVRSPWPLVEYERTPSRQRLSVWPFYERTVTRGYHHGQEETRVTRFGWKWIELYDDETRVFPFWVSSKDYFRLWPFWESETTDGVTEGRFLSLMPIRHTPAVKRNWSKFWTFYESRSCPLYTDHSLFWGIIRWRTDK